jgi:energy-coupling factor transport system substrate-specific component
MQRAAMRSNSLNTLDIVIIAVLGVVFGILNSPFGTIYQTFQAMWGPIGSNVFGVFDISQVLAMYIVRKPGAAFINMMINGLVQMLSGNPAGVITLGWGFTQGLGTEVVFAATKYRRFDWLTCFLGGGLANAVANVWTIIVYGFIAAGAGTLVAGVVLGLFTYGIASGIVAWILGNALKKAGVLASFRAGNEPEILTDDMVRGQAA